MHARILALAFSLLAGCASTPQEHYYTLATDLPAGPVAVLKAYSVAVGPVALPALVDRPQWVVKTAANQVVVLEQQRWAAPLNREIARVIAANLGPLLGTTKVSTSSQEVFSRPDYRVAVDIQRFDSMLGEGVNVEALWAVRRSAGGEPRTGRSQVREPTTGAGYPALAAAHSRALAAVSRDIAETIRSFDAAGGAAK